jgi:hypothetical protein
LDLTQIALSILIIKNGFSHRDLVIVILLNRLSGAYLNKILMNARVKRSSLSSQIVNLVAKKIYRIGSSLTSSSSSSSSTAKGEVEADSMASSWGSSTAGVNVIKLFSSIQTAG